ncbi:Polynucleotide adenylyltransferase family protein [Hibiscus syriacus]|uniref:DNA-directed RNA polymerase n=1 Tax=Hibiscus syriacus TaxID=106335 RepID=A0A6A3B4G2_HIBSY|nr:Polynucleotide adenylyltransferase family protein [Hibiscus syriacus]
MERNSPKQISAAIENLLKTGRLITQTGLDLQQRAGFTVQAERLNYHQFISFFRSVHRGASFAGLRTTSVRKLLPESWGFLCPVHTPDGEPCGFLNHMTCTCLEEGMIPSLPKVDHVGPSQALPVLLDGCVIGSLSSGKGDHVVANLRKRKVPIPDDLEVGYVPLSLGGTYPGLYLFTFPSRFIMPVRNISSPSADGKDIELIGPFEQVFMEIKCADGGDEGRSTTFPATHEEIMPTAMLKWLLILHLGPTIIKVHIQHGGCHDFNKPSVERGMCHGKIDQVIHGNEPYWSTINQVTNSKRTYTRKGSEVAIVDYVAVDTKNKQQLQKVNIHFRHPRNPVIGDKFSSIHGKKGVCSQLWPDIDMPFSGVTGMRPDLIINPHAFPSRMTIGMLVESVAAKGGSLRGKFVDAKPFSDAIKGADGKTETGSESLIDELGSMLRARGFNYHGAELTCEIFIGPVYYQRLRHMVSDKYQIRATGQVDYITQLPIKGRKRGGGIRFGEMERDSMLAHGAAYLLHDRLHTCSDYHIANVCSVCGSILTPAILHTQKSSR